MDLNSMLPLLLFSGGRGLGGNSMIRKSLVYNTMGLPGLLLAGGGFSIRDMILVPMVAGQVAGMFGGLGGSNTRGSGSVA